MNPCRVLTVPGLSINAKVVVARSKKRTFTSRPPGLAERVEYEGPLYPAIAIIQLRLPLRDPTLTDVACQPGDAHEQARHRNRLGNGSTATDFHCNS